MSGHSKWSNIKRTKGAVDARKSQVFTKLAREITVAARQGGADPESNFRLRLVIQKARENNMPLDNIERAIKRGVGGGDGHVSLEELVYEGYGPGGAAILLKALTDNVTRTVAEVRKTFTKAGGRLGEAGCVAWNFESKGVIAVEAPDAQREELALLAIDAGAEDFEEMDGGILEVRTLPEAFEKVRRTLQEAGASVVRAEIAMMPRSVLRLDAKHAAQTLRLMDMLEELDDVQRVYTNADFPDEALEEYRASL